MSVKKAREILKKAGFGKKADDIDKQLQEIDNLIHKAIGTGGNLHDLSIKLNDIMASIKDSTFSSKIKNVLNSYDELVMQLDAFLTSIDNFQFYRKHDEVEDGYSVKPEFTSEE